MHKDEVIKDIQEIKTLMNRSSRFLSLSGYSGILAGVYALVGGFVVLSILQNKELNTNKIIFLSLLIGISVMCLSISTSLLLNSRVAKKNNENIWSPTARRLMFHFSAPFVSGALFVFVLLYHEYYELLSPVMLVFYGLAVINASKFTFGSTQYLGIACLLLGFFNLFVFEYGVFFWMLGFGFCHIVYGVLMLINQK